jgi:hypothetical protein
MTKDVSDYRQFNKDISPYILHIYFSPRHGARAPSGPGPPHYRDFMITLRHTTVGRTPLDT